MPSNPVPIRRTLAGSGTGAGLTVAVCTLPRKNTKASSAAKVVADKVPSNGGGIANCEGENVSLVSHEAGPENSNWNSNSRAGKGSGSITNWTWSTSDALLVTISPE